MGSYLLVAFAVAAAEPSIADLDWMIGDWTFEDRATEAADFKYEERGTRSCRWAMRNQYIRCESQGGTGPKGRTYVSYINYNWGAKRFEMLSMWSNHPPEVVQVGQLSSDKRTLELENAQPATAEDGTVTYPWAIIRFDGVNGYVWESGARASKGGDKGPARFRDRH